MQYVDYYKALGVTRSATAEEITKAYKRQARKFHPDLNKDPNAEAKFKEINEAHEVLKNPETRQRYDTLGANWKHGSSFEPPPEWGNAGGVRFNFGGSGGGGGGGFSDFFESILGGLGGARSGRRTRGGFNMEDLFSQGAAGGAPARGQDVESTLTIDLDDAYHGRKRAIELQGPQGNRRYDVTIPRGIVSGEKIRLTGQGTAGGGGTGDLYLTIQIRPHPQFQRDGADLIVKVPVKAWDAALGAKIPVPTMDGTAHMTLPAGQSSGQRLRLRAKGMPQRGGSRGDLYAEIQITVPSKISDRQRELFTALRDATKEPHKSK